MGYKSEYDGIIVGAGHNALIAQAYLARAGLETLSIERGQHAGGGLQSPEDNSVPGVLHGTHAMSLRGITQAGWFRDLELDRWRVRFAEPELNITSLLRDGRSIRWYLDADRTAESIAQLSQRDAEAWRTIAREHRELTDQLLLPEFASCPIPWAEREALLKRSELGRRYLQLSERSPKEFIEDTFEHPAVKAMLLYFCIVREVDVNVRGQGLLVPSYLATTRPGQFVIGGTYQLARALKHEVYDHGGHIMEQEAPRRIVVENGRAVGVELSDGTVIRARRFVVSSLNPQQTFLQLLNDGDVQPAIRERAQSFRYQEVGQIFGVNVALREAPRYVAEGTAPEIARSFLVFMGLDDPAPIYKLYEDAPAGRLSEQIMLIGATPTANDPTQGGDGHHAAFMWQKAPYALNGNPRNWDAHKARQLDAILEFWERYAPNMGGGNVMTKFAGSPLDTERKFPSFARGDLFHGWGGPGQQGVDRPLPGVRPYRTPIDGLFLCGSSTHPGGNAWGLPGYIAAAEIAGDIGAERWWDNRNLWDRLRAA